MTSGAGGPSAVTSPPSLRLVSDWTVVVNSTRGLLVTAEHNIVTENRLRTIAEISQPMLTNSPRQLQA